jgi:hypothetical protein
MGTLQAWRRSAWPSGPLDPPFAAVMIQRRSRALLHPAPRWARPAARRPSVGSAIEIGAGRGRGARVAWARDPDAIRRSVGAPGRGRRCAVNVRAHAPHTSARWRSRDTGPKARGSRPSGAARAPPSSGILVALGASRAAEPRSRRDLSPRPKREHAAASRANPEQRQLLLPVSDNYFCRFRPRPSARSTARFSAPSVR